MESLAYLAPRILATVLNENKEFANLEIFLKKLKQKNFSLLL